MSAITELNDAFRRTFSGGRVVVTRGVASYSPEQQAEILRRVREFDAFTDANDPWGEHDFGSFVFKGQMIFWKIDLYDRDLKLYSPDPEDPAVTVRVLTVMLAGEY